MANQIPLTAKEIGKYVGVSKVDKLKWGKAVYAGANALRIAFVVFQAGGAVVGVLGIFAPVLGLATIFLGMGIPVAEAKAHVSKKAARQGYSIGLVLACFGYDKNFASTFFDNTWGSGGVTPSYMDGVFKKAYNTALALAYNSGCELSAEDKEAIRARMTDTMIKEAKRKGHTVYMDGWSDRDWVHNYARITNNHMLKD